MVLADYERFCVRELRLSPRTMRVRRRNVYSFLVYQASRGSNDVRAIGVETVSGFVTTRCHLKPTTLALLVSDLRCFLRFLSMKGLVQAFVVERVPKVRIRHDARVPEDRQPLFRPVESHQGRATLAEAQVQQGTVFAPLAGRGPGCTR